MKVNCFKILPSTCKIEYRIFKPIELKKNDRAESTQDTIHIYMEMS
jgi:hypothetical protein